LVLDEAIGRVIKLVLKLIDGLFDHLSGMPSLFPEIDVRNHSCTDNVLALVDKCLSHKLLNILDVLLINNFRENSQSVCLEHIIVDELHIFGEARDYDEHLVLVNMKLFDQNVNESSQVLIKLISL
jgi:hypothetical protein